MTHAKKIYLGIASLLVVLGLVLAGFTYVLSGCNEKIFSTHIDTEEGVYELGGLRIDNPPSIFPRISIAIEFNN